MTIDAFSTRDQPLLTERDMRQRITDLLAPAIHPGQLWVLLLDRLRVQSPVVIPIEDCPGLPDPATLDSLAGALRAVLDDLPDGPGSVIFVRERLGTDQVTVDDHGWAAGLTGACDRAGVAVTGVFLLAPHRVVPVPA
jgi:hypothetical protein